MDRMIVLDISARVLELQLLEFMNKRMAELCTYYEEISQNPALRYNPNKIFSALESIEIEYGWWFDQKMAYYSGKLYFFSHSPRWFVDGAYINSANWTISKDYKPNSRFRSF